MESGKRTSDEEAGVKMVMELCLATIEYWSLPDHLDMMFGNK